MTFTPRVFVRRGRGDYNAVNIAHGLLRVLRQEAPGAMLRTRLKGYHGRFPGVSRSHAIIHASARTTATTSQNTQPPHTLTGLGSIRASGFRRWNKSPT